MMDGRICAQNQFSLDWLPPEIEVLFFLVALLYPPIAPARYFQALSGRPRCWGASWLSVLAPVAWNLAAGHRSISLAYLSGICPMLEQVVALVRSAWWLIGAGDTYTLHLFLLVSKRGRGWYIWRTVHGSLLLWRLACSSTRKCIISFVRVNRETTNMDIRKHHSHSKARVLLSASG